MGGFTPKKSEYGRFHQGVLEALPFYPAAANRKATEIIRNTYRTLMTRGQKGCYVYSVDPTTNAFLNGATGKLGLPMH